MCRKKLIKTPKEVWMGLNGSTDDRAKDCRPPQELEKAHEADYFSSCVILICDIFHCVRLHCVKLHYIILLYVILHCIILYCIILHCVTFVLQNTIKKTLQKITAKQDFSENLYTTLHKKKPTNI